MQGQAVNSTQELQSRIEQTSVDHQSERLRIYKHACEGGRDSVLDVSVQAALATAGDQTAFAVARVALLKPCP